MRGIGVANNGLRGRQLLAEVDQDVALSGHARERRSVCHLGVAELADCGAVGLQRFGSLLQVGEVLLRQFRREAAEAFQGGVDGVQRRLLGFGLAAVGVAANLVARLLEQLAQFDHLAVVGNAFALQHGFFDRADLRHGVVSVYPQFAPGVFTSSGCLGHVGKGALVLSDGDQLLVDHGCIGRLFDQERAVFRPVSSCPSKSLTVPGPCSPRCMS